MDGVHLRLYCDMNVYNRCFDDQSQLRVRLETAAVEGIFALAEARRLMLIWSFMLDYENSLNPYEDRKEGVELLSRLCADTILPSPAVLNLARGILKSGKVKARDAVHLACAETAECDYFVTCDDALIRGFERDRRMRKLKVKAINPVEFIKIEGEKYGQS
jgi:predicted nucleic acid-binding protein